MTDLIITQIRCFPIKDSERAGWKPYTITDPENGQSRYIYVTREVQDALRQVREPANHKKIVTLEELLAVHRRGFTVWTNGCFDLLGPHHIYLLQEARRHGDTLVVGLNSDKSVRTLKGPSRPIQSQEHRAAMLAALDCVDYVVIFDERTPLEILRAYRPSILVKADMPDRNTDGDEWCARVELVKPVPGLSTTETIRRIREVTQDG
jgi:D-beta-D-heptose 7-phosphate kinase/D-beta-D-heptose 1-phosphate adenosyltransferase